MAHDTTMDGGRLAAQLSATLGRYDPLEPPRRGSGRWVALVSIALHLLLLWAFWNTLLGQIIKLEETVVVRMFNEPEPEPPKLRRKVLRQRMIDASVHRFKEIHQPEVVEVKPLEVLDSVKRVQVEQMKLTEAPKQIETKKIVTEKISVFADRVSAPTPTRITQTDAAVHQVKAAKATTGPKKLEAAGPTPTARAADVEAPTLTSGVIANNAVDGDVEGAKVASIESGTSDRMLSGAGERGRLGGVQKDCMKDPVCRKYLKMIEDRVYSRWLVPSDLAGGRVKLRFRIDRGGSTHSISVANATDKLLGETCIEAFRHASPFPPPPKEIHYLVNQAILASFRADMVKVTD